MVRQGPVDDLESARRYLAWLRGQGRRAWAWVGDDDVLVGVVAATVDDLNRSGWIFYWTHAEHRGRGVSARAVSTVCDHLLSNDGLERLELGHRVNNPASGRVAVAAGFIPEGLERGKFLIEGERIDVRTYGRLVTDPWPTGRRVEMDGREGGEPHTGGRRGASPGSA